MYKEEIQKCLKNLVNGEGKVGENVDINVERLITLSIENISVAYSAALYLAGFKAGREFVKTLDIKDMCELKDKIKESFEKSGLGEVEIDKQAFIVTKNSTCYGMESIGKKVCYFKLGFFSGAVSEMLGKDVKGTETMCYANGDECCRFEIE